MEKAHQTCAGPRFPKILMNKVQDSCTGPRFPRIPRFSGTLPGSCLIVPKNLGILGNLGPVHESCTLFIGILGNLGPVQVLFPSIMLKSKFFLQYFYGRKLRRFRNRIGDNVPNSFLARKFEVPNGHNVEKRLIKGGKKSEHSLRWSMKREVNRVVQLFGDHFFDYVFISLKLTFWSISIPEAVLPWWPYSFPIHFLFISSSFLSLFLVHCLFIPVPLLFISYLFPIHCLFVSFSCSFVFFIAFDLRNWLKFRKAMGFPLSISYLKTIYFKP